MRRRSPSIHVPALLRLLAPSPAAESPLRLHSEVDAWALRAAASNGFGGELPPASVRPPLAAARPAAFIDLSDPLASAVVRARRWARRAAAVLRLLRRRARSRESLGQLQCLDDATLRDLGLARSELASLMAESTGRAAATRRAITEQPRFPLRTATRSLVL